MKTEALVSMLSRGPIGADTRAPTRRLALATGPALLLAVLAMLTFLGLRPDLASAALQPMFWLKLAFPIALAFGAFGAAARLARPGNAATGAWAAIAATVIVVWAMAFISLAQAPSGARLAMVEGGTSLECVLSIALLALPLFAAALWAQRSMAPTRPRVAGAAAGLLAGSLAAAVYAPHCIETTLPFLAVWYVLGMLIPAALGALVGPRLLRWV